MRTIPVTVYDVNEDNPAEGEHVLVFVPQFITSIDAYYESGVYWHTTTKDKDHDKESILGWMRHPSRKDWDL